MIKEIEVANATFGACDRVSVGVCLVQQDCVVLFWNRFLEEWTKIPRSEILGKNLTDLFPHLKQPKYQRRLQQVFKGGFPAVFSAQLHRFTIPIPMPNGKFRIQQTTITPVPNFRGQGFYALMSIQDVTDLSLQVEKYQQEIKQRQLAEAELQRSNAELEQFAYIASHDLQEPLRMVTSFTNLLAQRYSGKLDADADQIINFATDGASRMQILINDLLSFSRVGTRGQPFEVVNCEEVLEKVLINLTIQIQDSGAQINKGPLPQVMADRSQLTQLFQNLIGNAIKYRREEPKVEIGAKEKENEWLFWVKDNGIGIDPAQSERVFLIFQRLHTRAEYPGTGIGLAICKKIVERHQGQIGVDSVPEKGSTFYFTIPK